MAAPQAAQGSASCGSVFLKRLSDTASAHLRTSGYRQSDAASLEAAANNPNVACRLRGVFPHPYSRKDAEFWISLNAITGPDDDCVRKCLPIVVVQEQDLDDARPYGALEEIVIGNIGLTSDENELGYWLAEEYWGRGIMKKALEKFVEWVFRAGASEGSSGRDISPLYARAASANPASPAVLASVGFAPAPAAGGGAADEVVEEAHPVCEKVGLPPTVALRTYVLSRAAFLQRRTGADCAGPSPDAAPGS